MPAYPHHLIPYNPIQMPDPEGTDDLQRRHPAAAAAAAAAASPDDERRLLKERRQLLRNAFELAVMTSISHPQLVQVGTRRAVAVRV